MGRSGQLRREGARIELDGIGTRSAMAGLDLPRT